MREFLYKNSFFRYAAAVSASGGKRVPVVAPFIAFYVLICIGLASGITSFSPAGLLVTGFACILFLASSIAGAHRGITPNVSRLMPIGSKRKCVYDFLTVLLYTVIAVVIAFVFLIAVALVVGVITLIADSGASEIEPVGEAFKFAPAGVYGGIFCAAYTVLLYSGGMAGGYFKNRRRRNIFFAVFTAAVTLGSVFTGLPYYLKAVVTGEHRVFGSPFSADCYAQMQFPWLCILFWCLIAAGMFATAIYMSWNYHKPKY